MATYIVYVDLQVPFRNVNQNAAQMARESGSVDMVYTELNLDDGQVGLTRMIDAIELASPDGSVLIIGDFSSGQSFILDELLANKNGWTVMSTTSSSPLLKDLTKGFSVHYSDIHTVASLILMTESLYPQVLIVVDGRIGVDLYYTYLNSITTQTVKLHVMTDDSAPLSDIAAYMNSPQTYIFSTLLGSKFDELMATVNHNRVVTMNTWRIDTDVGPHLNVVAAAPFPEKFGLAGIEAMTSDVLDFAGRVKKIRGNWRMDRLVVIGLWNQFVTDMKTPLAFFRNFTVAPELNASRLFGANFVSNQPLIQNVDVAAFNERNAEPFSQSVITSYIRHPSRTELDYWYSIKITPTVLENVVDRKTGEVLYQRFESSITFIDNGRILLPNPKSWSIEVDMDGDVVTGINALKSEDEDIFNAVPPTINRHIYVCTGYTNPVTQSQDSRFTDESVLNLDANYTPPDFYHSVI